jgi:hypothetical protein
MSNDLVVFQVIRTAIRSSQFNAGIKNDTFVIRLSIITPDRMYRHYRS